MDKAEEIIAARKRSISDLEAMRISAREARGLGRLGRRLRNIQRQPDQVSGNRTESDTSGVSHPQAGLNPNLNEPGSNDVNIPGQE